MKLSFEQIKAILTGVARTEEKDGMLSLYRFTQAQAEAYREYSTDFYGRGFASSGIRLDFTTRASALTLKLNVTYISNSFKDGFSYDVFVNGALLDRLSGDADINGIYEKTFALGEGEKAVTVYFPWNAITDIAGVETDGTDEPPVPAKRSLRMIQFGDSITQGYSTKNPSESYASLVATGLDAVSINKGIGGEIFFPTLATLTDDIQPDLITVAYGTNDWNKGDLDRFEKNSRAFYENLRATYPEAKIFVLAPLWRKDLFRENRGFELSCVTEHLKKIASSLENAYFIDCFDFIPHDEKYFYDEYLHPNTEGFALYAEGVLNAINGYLK